MVEAQAFQQAFEEAPRIAVPRTDAQPQAAPLRAEGLAELDGQGTLAETGRRRNQQQPPAEPGAQTLAEARPVDIAGGSGGR
jgi:hypothetical protein